MPTRRAKELTRKSSASNAGTETFFVPEVKEEMLNDNPWFEEIFEGLKTKIRVLILGDGDISFDKGKFGLTELINKALLPRATIWEDLEITTAHRSKNRTGAMLTEFRITTETLKREYYDQVWLFGHKGETENRGETVTCTMPDDALDDSELKLLTKFMNAGGGVFATGDHEDLGIALCGEVPRVRSMRKWRWCGVQGTEKAPGKNDETRIDTLREGHDPGFIAKDQADNIPQEIRPRHTKVAGENKSLPHELLRGIGDSSITVLPDHMHEGECVVPKGDALDQPCFKEAAALRDEFPTLPDTEVRLAPEVVAVATSAGGYLRDKINVMPVEPRCYNVIVAYDGERVGVGRVVVDATFHHFVDINLKGTGTDRKGMYDEDGNPTKDYLAIKQYYRNIVKWLCPPQLRSHYYMNMLLAVRYMSPLIEEIRRIIPIEKLEWQDMLFAGTVTRRAIAERFSEAEATQCALLAIDLSESDVRQPTKEFIDLAVRNEQLNLLFNIEIITTMSLGGAMLGIAANLPQSSCDVRKEIKNWGKDKEGHLRRSIGDGATRSLHVLSEIINVSNNKLADFFAPLEARLRPEGDT
jgi:hypothetical protein